jgi:hypothetical protein
MIQMPRRSVTRFFIPLIDVLILMFCIFLLLPVFKETDPENPYYKEKVAAKEQKAKLALLEEELRKLQEELARLKKKLPSLDPQQLAIKVLEIDATNGHLFYYDPGPPRRRKELSSSAEVDALVQKHRRELADQFRQDKVRRELHYLILAPRVESAFPEAGQLRQYREWFKNVPHTIDWPGGAP